jgi:hypothetical protein
MGMKVGLVGRVCACWWKEWVEEIEVSGVEEPGLEDGMMGSKGAASAAAARREVCGGRVIFNLSAILFACRATACCTCRMERWCSRL